MIEISKNESRAIDMMRFLCVISIVFLHTNTNHLIPDNIVTCASNIEFFIVKFYIDGALNFMFVLSGYLFFRKEINYCGNGYIRQLKSRISSLLVPYILWCFIGMVYSIIMNEVNFEELSIQRIFWGIPETSWHPIGRVVWYIRDLIVFSLLSPIYYILAKKLGILGFFLIIAINHFDIILIGHDLPTFNIYIFLGAILSVNGITFSQIVNDRLWKIAIPIYIIYNYCSSFYNIEIPLFSIISWIGLFSFCLKFKLHSNIVITSSFIYFIHSYFSSLFRVSLTYVIEQNDIYTCILTYLLSITFSLLFCFITFYLMKYIMPSSLKILTGGRI